jgi:septal ring factor EnvC (AmiA/AmiB activator)
MAAQISDSQTSSNDQKSEIADLNKHLIEAAAEKDRLEAEVAYLKVRIFQDFFF